MAKSELTDVSMHLHYVNERSIKASADGVLKNAVILPSSQIELAHFGEPLKEDQWGTMQGKVVEITMPIWLATEKGLI